MSKGRASKRRQADGARPRFDRLKIATECVARPPPIPITKACETPPSSPAKAPCAADTKYQCGKRRRHGAHGADDKDRQYDELQASQVVWL
mmetsp:Transcript_36939/g.73096  ORF Transcript_36939/g.73096 Transcript_36939/m.73096 type:complete len:91 (-) Transcript_36939:90-362(-)